MNISDVFKQNARAQLGAAGTVGLVGVALLAGYNGHPVMEAGAALAAGLTAGTTLWIAKNVIEKTAAPEAKPPEGMEP